MEITRTGKTGTLKVDSGPVISATSLGDAVALDVSSDFYLGGVPQLSYVNPSAVFDSSSLKDFVGCVSSVRVCMPFSVYCILMYSNLVYCAIMCLAILSLLYLLYSNLVNCAMLCLAIQWYLC